MFVFIRAKSNDLRNNKYSGKMHQIFGYPLVGFLIIYLFQI